MKDGLPDWSVRLATVQDAEAIESISVETPAEVYGPELTPECAQWILSQASPETRRKRIQEERWRHAVVCRATDQWPGLER